MLLGYVVLRPKGVLFTFHLSAVQRQDAHCLPGTMSNMVGHMMAGPINRSCGAEFSFEDSFRCHIYSQKGRTIPLEIAAFYAREKR